MIKSILLSIILILISYSSFSQNDVFENEVTQKNGKVYYQKKLLSGTLYSEQDGIANDCDCTLKANYKQGLLDGNKKEWFTNGKLKYSGNYSKGNRVGIHQTFYNNGKIRKKETYENSRVISATLYNKDGSIKGGNRPTKQQVSKGTKPNYYPVNTTTKKTLTATDKSSPTQLYGMNQMSYIQNGLQRFYHPNGLPKRVCLYKNGLLVKDSVFYESGKKERIKKFNDGELIHLEEYNEEAHLIKEENYENNKKHGQQRLNFPNGKVKSIENYENGMLLHREIFNEKEIIIVDESYKFDKKDGIHKYYDNNGELKELKEFNMGALTKHEVFTEEGKEQINVINDLYEIKTYNANDVLIKIRYERGVERIPDGIWIDYEPETGYKLNETTYKAGRLIRKGKYINNKKQGAWISYSENKENESRTYYDAGTILRTETLTYAKQIKNNYNEGDLIYQYKTYLPKEKNNYILIKLDSINGKSRRFIKDKILETLITNNITPIINIETIMEKELYAKLHVSKLQTRIQSKKNENRKFVFLLGFDLIAYNFTTNMETIKNFTISPTNAKNTNINNLYRKEKKEAFFETLNNLGDKMDQYIRVKFPLTGLIQKRKGKNTIYLNLGAGQHVEEDDVFNVLDENKHIKARVKVKEVFGNTSVVKITEGESWLTNYFKTHKNPQVARK